MNATTSHNHNIVSLSSPEAGQIKDTNTTQWADLNFQLAYLPVVIQVVLNVDKHARAVICQAEESILLAHKTNQGSSPEAFINGPEKLVVQ
jgi:hypothetical protein